MYSLRPKKKDNLGGDMIPHSIINLDKESFQICYNMDGVPS